MIRPKSARVDPSSETVADFKYPPQGSPSSGSYSSSTETSLAAGKVLANRYEIVRLLGSGGMGSVYEALDCELNRKVAIKIIRQDLASDPEIVLRFKQELLTATQVSHRNVVRIYDLGEAENTKFISMELLDGDDLGTLISARGQFSVSEAADIVRQVAAGLEAAHGEGVVHRDLKPANIMLNSSGRVHVTDFGIARSAQFSGMTQTGMMIGTIEYMAPEQAKGAPADVRSDIYAVGLILYELLTGTAPFHSETPLGSLYKRIEGPPPDPAKHNVNIPQELRAILFRLLQPDPKKRYQAAAEIIRDLDRWQSGVSTPSARKAVTLTLPRLSRKSVLGSIVLAVILTIASATGGLWHRFFKPEVEPKALKVLIGDFKNDTGDPVFAGTLEPTMGIALEGAPFINLFNRGQARKSAQQLQPGATTLDQDLTRMVASREGVQVVVSGKIESAGDGYKVSGRAVDTVTGKIIAERELLASNKDEVLRITAELAAHIRNQLGDSTPPSLQLAAAETFTAATLESAHEYAQAQELQSVGKSAEAIKHYKKATQLDPNLGRAFAGLAVANFNLKQRSEAEENYAKAMALLDHMSEREKYRTLGAYYLTYVNNYPKAIETYRKLVELYPSDSAGHNNLSIAYVYTLQMQAAVESVKKALEINPGNLQHRLNFALYSMYNADFPTAITEAKKVLKENPKYEFAYLPLAVSSLASGDEVSALAAYHSLSKLGSQGSSMSALGLADMEMYRGRFEDAVKILRPAIAADLRENLNGELAQKYVALAQAHLGLHQSPQARQAASQAIAIDKNESVVVPAALVLAEVGDVNGARKVAVNLATLLPEQSRSYGRLIEGVISLKRKKYPDAINTLEQALKLRDSWLVHFWLAQAYIEAGHFAEALQESEICEKRRGETTDLFFADTITLRALPQLYQWKARAQAGLGQVAAAGQTKQYYASLRPAPAK